MAVRQPTHGVVTSHKDLLYIDHKLRLFQKTEVPFMTGLQETMKSRLFAKRTVPVGRNLPEPKSGVLDL